MSQLKEESRTLILNQKLEMTKLSEESTLKVETGQKLGLLHQTAKSWEPRISARRKLKELLPQNKHKQAYKWMHYSEGKRSRGRQGWNGWMASLAQWTWVWANSGRWWRTGRPSMLQSTGSQRLRHDWATEQLNEHVNDKKTKQSYCWYGQSLSGLERRSNRHNVPLSQSKA